MKATLTARDREICAAIGPALRERGLIFVGIDVIGDYLTEINVTSPTGLQEINRLDGVDAGERPVGRDRSPRRQPRAAAGLIRRQASYVSDSSSPMRRNTSGASAS